MLKKQSTFRAKMETFLPKKKHSSRKNILLTNKKDSFRSKIGAIKPIRMPSKLTSKLEVIQPSKRLLESKISEQKYDSEGCSLIQSQSLYSNSVSLNE